MACITIDISDEQLSLLNELAQNNHISPQDLLRASLEDWLACPKQGFAETAAYVIKKNAELYNRLA